MALLPRMVTYGSVTSGILLSLHQLQCYLDSYYEKNWTTAILLDTRHN